MLQWKLERSEVERSRLTEELRQTTHNKHALGASAARLGEQHMSDAMRLQATQAQLEALQSELRVEKAISKERMATLIQER